MILFFIIFGMTPLLFFRFSYFSSYEAEMVASRMSELQNQCNILSRQLTNGNRSEEHTSELQSQR